VEVPAKAGKIPSPAIPRSDTVRILDTLYVNSEGYEVTFEDSNLVATVKVEPLFKMAALDYIIKAYKIRDTLVVTDTIRYIGAEKSAWDNWLYIPAGILVGAAGATIWSR
jgi:hypothetical protein